LPELSDDEEEAKLPKKAGKKKEEIEDEGFVDGFGDLLRY
jgi:hypothetical protein